MTRRAGVIYATLVVLVALVVLTAFHRTRYPPVDANVTQMKQNLLLLSSFCIGKPEFTEHTNEGLRSEVNQWVNATPNYDNNNKVFVGIISGVDIWHNQLRFIRTPQEIFVRSDGPNGRHEDGSGDDITVTLWPPS